MARPKKHPPAGDDPVPPIPPESTLATQAAQIAGLLDARERQVAEREEQLAEARAAFRRERDQHRAARDTADTLKREARGLHREADRERDRVRRLAARFLGQLRRRWHVARQKLDAEARELAASRAQFRAEVERFEAVRSEFHTTAAAANDRLRDAWAAVDAQRKRVAAERAEANDYLTKQEAAFAARAAELAEREKAVGTTRAAAEKDAAALRREAAGLETRIQHTRMVVDDLEKKRDRLRAEAQFAPAKPGNEPPPAQRQVALNRAADRDLATWAVELDAHDRQLADERQRLASVKTDLDRDATDLADQRRVLAEQFSLLAAARGRWHQAERTTVAEMEELARGLRVREQDLDARDRRLIRADARRREDAHELWQLRLRLEGWQAKLTAYEAKWQAERQRQEADLAARVQAVTRRETDIEALFARWERMRERERERLTAELRLWAEDRAQLAKAAAGYDRLREDSLAEVAAHAARALATEQAVAEMIQAGGSPRVTRRLAVLQRRWERAFGFRLKEIDRVRAVAVIEQSELDDRFKDLGHRLAELAAREAAATNQLAHADLTAVLGRHDRGLAPPARQDSTELVTLRDEVERVAKVMLDARWPDPPDSELPFGPHEPGDDELPWGPDEHPPEAELPWGAEEAADDTARIFRFEPPARAA